MSNSFKLPEPQKDLDFPLMKAIEMRRTKRRWKNADLSDQEVSNLLWVACGISQQGKKSSKSKRTVPSACNSQEIKIYVALSSGLFLYDELENLLVKVLSEDIRKDIGTQKMMQSAPLGLIYVSDFLKMNSFLFRDNNQRWYTSATDAGFISQNIYLYCAAANLSTAVLGLVDRDLLHKRLGLNENEKVVYTQVVGKSMDNQF